MQPLTIARSDSAPIEARSPWPSRISALLAGLVIAASVLYLLHLGRRTTFFYDEWSWLVGRRGWRPGNFLVSHNGHFVALPVLIYHLLYATVGLKAYLPYRLVLMAFHAGVCAVVYLYARRRVDPWLALVAAGAMCLIGPAFQGLVWPFQMTLVGALFFGLAAFLVLDDEPTRRRDVLSLLLLLAAISCSGVGLAMLVGAAVRVAGRRQWRRWWVIVAPAVVFVLWYLRYGGDPAQASSTGHKLAYLADEFRAGVGGLTGHPATAAIGLAVVLCFAILALVLLRLGWDGLHRRQLPVDLLSVVATALALWGLTAVARAKFDDFGSSRYLYGGGLVIVLVLVEVLRGVRWQPVLAAVLALATVLSIHTGLDTLRPGTRSLTNADIYTRADLAAVEQLRDPVLGYQINSRVVPTLTIGQYLSIRRDLGSPAMPFAAVATQSAGVRNDVDRVLREAGGLHLNAASAPTTHVAVRSVGSAPPTLSGLAGCTLLRSDVAGGSVTVVLPLPASGLVITAQQSPVLIFLHRFGPTAVRYGSASAGASMRLTPQSDASPKPWTVQLRSTGSLQLCS